MATLYPSARQTFTNASGTQLLSSPDHGTTHAVLQDTVTALEDTVGTTNGTNLMRNAAAGDFGITATAGGTVQQALGNLNLTGGTLKSVVLGTATGTVNLAVGTIATLVSTTGTVTTLNPGTVTTVNSIPGSALSTNANFLAYTTLGSTFTTTSGSAVQVVPLNGTVTVPSGSRKVKITAYSGQSVSNTQGTQFVELSIWKGVVGTAGTQLNKGLLQGISAGQQSSLTVLAIDTPSAGIGTYSVGLSAPTGGTATINGGATFPGFILCELL